MNKKYVFGFANLDENNPYSIDLRENLQAAVASVPNVELVIRDNAMNSERAKANIEDFMKLNVDVVVMCHIDQRASQNIVFPVRLKRTPVLAIDIPIAGTHYFGVNNLEAGHMASRALVKWVQQNWNGQIDKIACITEHRVLDFTHQRFDSVVEAAQTHCDFEVKQGLLYLDNGSSPTVTKERFTTLLQRWQEKHIVAVCINDSTMRGVIDAVRAEKRTEDVAIVSYDGTHVAFEAFESPDIQLVASPFIDVSKSGAQILQLCMKMANHETIPAATYLPTFSLTWKNYKEFQNRA